MADVGHQRLTKSVFYTPNSCKIIREFILSIVLMLISLNYCLNACDDEKRINLFDFFVDYQNVGPIMNFLSVFTHARDRCFVTSEYVTNK